MKKKTDFALYITKFLTEYLTSVKNMSPNTVVSYRDTIVLLISFMCEKHSARPETLETDHFTAEIIREFLDCLEREHNCSISTRNQRLAAIHSLFRFISVQNPEYMFQAQQILSVPSKKTTQKTIKHLETGQIKELLSAPDSATLKGRRDQALLCLLYDSGCRVQELADLHVMDIRLTTPAQVTLTGKGRKTRVVPLTDETKAILEHYVSENGLNVQAKQDAPLFYNCHGKKLTRQGITYILKKYTESIGLVDTTPHVIRHSKAMHMTEADINPIYIRDFLGHTDLKVTQIYSKTSVEMKRRALDKLKGNDTSPPTESKDWTDDDDLMKWLGTLGH